MTTPGTLQILHVAILNVETLASGRSKVTFRTARSEANLSGIDTAYTAPLTTEEGRTVSAGLRRRIRTWPMTLLRTTAIGISFEPLADGSSMRIISEVMPTPESAK